MAGVHQRAKRLRVTARCPFIAAYILLAALPGDAVLARYGNPDLGLTAAQLAEIRAAYGADRPQLVQFFEAWGMSDEATLAARRKLSSLLFS